MKVYFISGLGANQTAFNFLDLSWCEPVFIQWQTPAKQQSLRSYAFQLREQIEEKNPVVVGVSFGGMLATEMARADKNVRAIIVSSNKSSAEFPPYLRMWKYLPVYRWVPPRVITASGRLVRPFIGPQGRQQKAVFNKIMHDTNPVFTAWAINAILHWKTSQVPANVVHIHGSADRLLPARLARPHHIIKGGKHIMIMDKADELSMLLKRLVLEG